MWPTRWKSRICAVLAIRKLAGADGARARAEPEAALKGGASVVDRVPRASSPGPSAALLEPSWEYREVFVPLGLSCHMDASAAAQQECVQRCEAWLHYSLASDADDGWLPEGSLSLAALWETGRLARREVGDAFVFDGAWVQLKRRRLNHASSRSAPNG